MLVATNGTMPSRHKHKYTVEQIKEYLYFLQTAATCAYDSVNWKNEITSWMVSHIYLAEPSHIVNNITKQHREDHIAIVGSHKATQEIIARWL